MWKYLWMDVSIYVSQVEYVSMYASIYVSMDVSLYLSVYVCEYVCLSDMDDIM